MRCLLLLSVALVPCPAVAAPCTESGLAGIWSLVSIRSANPGVEQFYRQAPHELMRFGPGDRFIYVAASQPYTPATAARSLEDADRVDGVTYGFRVAGEQLLLTRDGTPFEGFVCRIADRAEAGVQGGDMILSALPGRAMLRRVQRRFTATPG